MRHAQHVLAAQQPGRDGSRLFQLGYHPLLADQVAEDRRAAHRYFPVHPHSTIAGKLPVLASAMGGIGSGSISRTRSWIARLTSSGRWDASSTR